MKKILRFIRLFLIAFVIVKSSTFGWRLGAKAVIQPQQENKHLAQILKGHVYKLAHEIGERSVYKYDQLQKSASSG